MIKANVEKEIGTLNMERSACIASSRDMDGKWIGGEVGRIKS